jgi:hypothetical protein
MKAPVRWITAFVVCMKANPSDDISRLLSKQPTSYRRRVKANQIVLRNCPAGVL